MGANLPYRPGAGVHQLADSGPTTQVRAFFSAHGTIGLVADLHHAHIHSCLHQLLQGNLCILIQRLCLGFHGQFLPFFWGHLLGWVCPKIRIVEVDQQFHAILGGAFSDGNGIFNIAVTAAISLAIGCIGVVPDPDTDIVDAIVAQDLIDILRTAVMVIIANAALFQCRHTGSIHAYDEIIRHIFHFFDE